MERPKHDSLIAIAITALAFLGIPVSQHFSDRVTFAYIGALLALSISVLVYSLRWAKRTGLLCHTCNRPMLRRAADIAIDTGTCPHCRKAAFSGQA
jgi:hypothetical protein